MKDRFHVRSNLVFNKVVLIMLVYNHQSACECIRDEAMARACLQYSWQMMASRVIRIALVILLYHYSYNNFFMVVI